MTEFLHVLKLNSMSTDKKKEYSILRHSYNINVQDLTFLSTNGCRVDTDETFLYVFRFLNLKDNCYK